MDRVCLVISGIGILCFLWFAIPLFANIINIGNITGMTFAALLTGYGIFHKKVHEWIAAIAGYSAGKMLLLVVLVAAIFVFLLAAAETVCIVKSAMNHPPVNTTAVLLGCKVNGTKPCTVLQERIMTAYEYLSENKKAVCVLSGGKGESEEISEAECMYRYLTQMGIASERLILEDQSTNTEENLVFSQNLLKQYGMDETITIITSEFHEYRANKTAQRLGIKSYSTSSHTFFLYLPTYYVRELYGILYYGMR